MRHSLPDALCRIWFEAYGAERARALCAACNEPPEVALRPNTLRAAPGEVEAELEAAGVPFTADAETGALVLGAAFDLGGSRIHGDGLAVAQSRGSILAGARVGAQPGMRVLDLCAAPGGKTSQLAAAGAEVVAVERNAGRAGALRATLERLGAAVEVVEADARTLRGRSVRRRPAWMRRAAGNGVLNGRPDARWRRGDGSDEAALARLQSELAAHAATLVAPGGRVVYAVCTLNPAENDGALRAGGLEPREERRTWPDSDRTTGFYTALVG